MNGAQSVQPSLEGVEPAVAASADSELKVAVLGTLIHPAQVRVGPDSVVRVEVLVQQRITHHPRALPLFGSFPYPDQGCTDATLTAARKKAMHLHTGTEVMLAGRGLELGRHEGSDVFRVVHLDALDLTSTTH